MRYVCDCGTTIRKIDAYCLNCGKLNQVNDKLSFKADIKHSKQLKGFMILIIIIACFIIANIYNTILIRQNHLSENSSELHQTKNQLVLYFDDGTWTGEITNGKANGIGTMKFNNGDIYIGDAVENHIEGEGVFKYNNGDKYEGQFKNDIFDGQGKYTWSDGSYYDGEWSNGLKDGKGIIYIDGKYYNVVYQGDNEISSTIVEE
jgi:hypothetical protein